MNHKDIVLNISNKGDHVVLYTLNYGSTKKPPFGGFWTQMLMWFQQLLIWLFFVFQGRQSFPQRIQGGLNAVGKVQLTQDPADMCAHGHFRDE